MLILEINTTMDKALQPSRFKTPPNTSSSSQEYKHRLRTFEYFLDALPQEGVDKLKILNNFISYQILKYLSECNTYDSAVETLNNFYIKPPNTIFAQHYLATHRQQPAESFDEYIQTLKLLAKDCNFKTVTALQYQEEAIRDSFISGIVSNKIRQMTLEVMLDKARA